MYQRFLYPGLIALGPQLDLGLAFGTILYPIMKIYPGFAAFGSFVLGGSCPRYIFVLWAGHPGYVFVLGAGRPRYVYVPKIKCLKITQLTDCYLR